MRYIRNFKEISSKDLLLVGGKNASLGQMIQHLSEKDIKVPQGFAITVDAYWHHLEVNGLLDQLKKMIGTLSESSSFSALQKTGKKIRTLIESAPIPQPISKEITAAYAQLCKQTGQQNCIVAVRSSATAEDLPDASFAGQQESFLNVQGVTAVVDAYRACIASLFTDRAIMYRTEKGFDHLSVGISVGVQQMVRSDKASSGVIFTLDTESGFKDVIVISSAYGVGETVVKGEVVPDEFHVFKKTLGDFHPIIKKECGSKKVKRMFGKKLGTVKKAVLAADSRTFSITDEEIIQLAHYAKTIEDHYSDLKGQWVPMDIEWAKDGDDGQLYIVQARPETIHSQKKEGHVLRTYSLKKNQPLQVLVKGQSVGQKIVSGKARIIKSIEGLCAIEDGEILITHMTDPDWIAIMKKAGGIVTESGGRTCHAAIVSRELGIPAIVGAAGAIKKIQNGQYITIDCSSGSEGIVYESALAIDVQEVAVHEMAKMPVKILLNVASPERAYTYSMLPVEGVGLARLEFIISNNVQVHPMALVQPEKVKDARVHKLLEKVTAAYASPQDFFVKKVAEGMGTIAAAFFPRPVLVRFSDFKSNEYRGLLGGSYFEPIEENPMMGLRGASRYYHELYAPAFELECQAVSYARNVMGLTNINVMIPFVRTIEEARKVVELLRKNGLESREKSLEIYMMCEIPSNVLLIEKFAHFFDGFSIGSNDLTQTTLSVDRDSGLLAPLFDERDEAVLKMLSLAIQGAHYAGRPIGICGQAPSDYPEIANFLIKEGIDSLSLNPDSVLPFLLRMGGSAETEEVKYKNNESIIPAQVAA